MQDKVMYLISKLSVDDVMEGFGVKSQQISQTLSSLIKENFNDKSINIASAMPSTC